MNRDEWSYLTCADCIHCGKDCNNFADGTIKFYKPYFATVPCSKYVCKQFSPKPLCKWLYEHWDGFDDYFKDGEHPDRVPLVLNDNYDVVYYIKWEDWIEGNFKDENGELKWFEKHYSKRTRSSPTGWTVVREKR